MATGYTPFSDIPIFLSNTIPSLQALPQFNITQNPRKSDHIIIPHRDGTANLPSGKRLHNYQKLPFSMGKSTISVAIFHSYVTLPEGRNTIHNVPRRSNMEPIANTWQMSFPIGKWPPCAERLVEIDCQLLGRQEESIIFEQQITWAPRWWTSYPDRSQSHWL